MAHIHEEIDFVVNAYITYEGKVLLVHHKKLNMWLPVGGHVELNEDTDEALFREISEECGLSVTIIDNKPITDLGFSNLGLSKFLHTPRFVDIHNITESHRHIALTYFAKAKSDKFVHNKEEHNDIKWFSKDDLENPEFKITPAVKFCALESLKSVK